MACNNKSYLLVNTWDKVPIGGKSSGDQNAAKMDFYGGNCDYKVFEMGWLLLTALESLLKELQAQSFKLAVLGTFRELESFYFGLKYWVFLPIIATVLI